MVCMHALAFLLGCLYVSFENNYSFYNENKIDLYNRFFEKVILKMASDDIK